MALTKAQIRDRAASELGVLPLGQALQHQDKVRIEQAYDEIYANLKSRGLASWSSTGSVPNEFVSHVVALVAYNCLNSYGVSNDRYNRISSKAGVAIQEITSLTNKSYSESQEEAQNF